MRLRMWQTEQSLEDVFLQLAADGMEQPVLKEIGKRRLFQRSLQDYNLHTV